MQFTKASFFAPFLNQVACRADDCSRCGIHYNGAAQIRLYAGELVNMPFTIDSASDIIFVRHFGIIDERELDEIRDRLVSLTKESGVRNVLIDTTDATWFPSTTDLLFSIERASRNQAYARTAVVLSGKHRETAGFITSACRNRGLQVRAFNDVDMALKWLNSNRDS